MSLTTMAICWNQASLLLDHTGMSRPVGGETYWVSSMICSPSLICTIRILALNTPTRASYSLPTTRKSATFSNCSTLAKKFAARSTSPTVKPIVLIRSTPPERSCAHARLDHAIKSTMAPASKAEGTAIRAGAGLRM